MTLRKVRTPCARCIIYKPMDSGLGLAGWLKETILLL